MITRALDGLFVGVVMYGTVSERWRIHRGLTDEIHPPFARNHNVSLTST